MDCPACKHELSEKQVGDVVVETCRGGCGGIWFDDRELRKFDDLGDIVGTELLSIERAENLKVDGEAIRYCPKCSAEELCRRFYDVHSRVEIDQCLHCSGIWLDVGELKEIRKQYHSDEERQNAGERFLNAHLDRTEDQLEIATARRMIAWEEDVSMTGTIKHLFKWLLG